jgi:hypothetical protein
LALTGAESTAYVRVADDRAPGHALGKDVVEEVLKHGGRKQLAEYVLREASGPHPELDRMQHRLRMVLAHW